LDTLQTTYSVKIGLDILNTAAVLDDEEPAFLGRLYSDKQMLTYLAQEPHLCVGG
jgi:hypothetical protein